EARRVDPVLLHDCSVPWASMSGTRPTDCPDRPRGGPDVPCEKGTRARRSLPKRGRAGHHLASRRGMPDVDTLRRRNRGTDRAARRIEPVAQSVLDANAPTQAAGPGGRAFELSSRAAFALHGAFVAALLVLSQLPLLDDRPVVRDSTVGAALLLLAWSVLLFGVVRRGHSVTLELAPRRQHYLQACQQGVVLLVWGYYWREVYHAAPLIVAQILFAYGLDSLLSWTRRGRFVLGFGPFPVVFSISLFLWF